jgi:hypothetical protein
VRTDHHMTLPRVLSRSSAWRISISPLMVRWAGVGTSPTEQKQG